MEDKHLEEIIEEELIEQGPAQERLLPDFYGVETEEHYLLGPETLEIMDAVERASESPPEDVTERYFLDPGLLEIEQALEKAREMPSDPEEQIRYLEPED